MLAASLQFYLQNAIDAVSLGSIYALFAVGIALIFGVMRLINIAHGELILIAGYTLFFLGGLWWPLFVLSALAAAAFAALLMERVAFRPVRHAPPETLMITSFAVGYLIQNLTILVIGAEPKTVNISTLFTESFVIGTLRIPKIDLFMVGTALAWVLALGLFLKKTRIGVQMRAAAEDFQMARLLGVRANLVIAMAFIVGGLLAGSVAILLVGQTGTLYPTVGLAPLLVGLVAGVLGGIGSLPGAALGGYVLGFLTVGLQTWLPESMRSFRDAFVYSVVIVILLFRPQGLFVGPIAKRV